VRRCRKSIIASAGARLRRFFFKDFRFKRTLIGMNLAAEQVTKPPFITLDERNFCDDISNIV
jgi:hypothetical protein